MKTTKEQRDSIRKMTAHFRENDDGPINRIIDPLLDDLDTALARVKVLEEALERMVRFNPSYEYTFENARSQAAEALARSRALGEEK